MSEHIKNPGETNKRSRPRAIAPLKEKPSAVIVAGARPNFIKIAPIIREMEKSKRLTPLLLHTGQHYDYEMSRIFFDQLNIGKPDFFLEVGSGSHARQTAKIMVGAEQAFESARPAIVIVAGDVNSTMACCVTAKKMNIPVAHVESGLRSRDMTMPEEINRIVTDSISDILYTTSRDADENLIREGADPDKIRFVGNAMIDTLVHSAPLIGKSRILTDLKLKKGKYALLTLHRPVNVDEPEQLAKVESIIRAVGSKLPIIYPVHPRTAARLREFGVDLAEAGATIVPPLGYFDFLRLMRDSAVALTDSGGVQEETTFLGVPCLTLRENTERPVTVFTGTNKIVGLNEKFISKQVDMIINGRYKKGRIPPLWDGRASKRIVADLDQSF